MSNPISQRSSLVFLAITLLTFLAASSAPTPLYHLYQEGLHFSAGMLTLIFGVYALSLLVALLTVGSLSDHLGRKPVIFTALILNMLAMLLFINEGSVAWLIAARTLQGFATGMATAVLGAALLDTDRQQGPLVNSVAPLLGMACGAMGSSLLVEFAPLPTQLIYCTLFVLMLLQAVYVWRLPESVSRIPGALASLRPTLHVPPQARRALGMCHVLGADAGVEDVADGQLRHLLEAIVAIVHLHPAIQHHKHFFAVIDVPAVRLVGPVQARGDAVHVGDVQRLPGPAAGEVLAADDLHA
jgi:MFS family permease